MKEFPELEVCRLGSTNFDITDGVVHGRVDFENVCSCFECEAMPSKSDWHVGGARIDGEDIPNHQSGLRILCNFMVVGTTTADNLTKVKRITFRSRVVEDALVLWPLDFRTLLACNQTPPLWRTEGSAFDHKTGVRLRVQRRAYAQDDLAQGSRIVISFTNYQSIKEAYAIMLSCQNLFSLICGEMIDLFDPQFIIEKSEKCFSVKFFHFNPSREAPPSTSPRRAALALTSNSRLMKTIVLGWAAQSRTVEIATRILLDVVKEQSFAKFSQLKELITCIEMLADTNSKPISRSAFVELRDEVKALIKRHKGNNSDNDGFDEIDQRFNYVNSTSARAKMLAAFAKIAPELLENNFGENREQFISQILQVRDGSTHDPSLLTQKQYKNLSWFIAKMKFVVNYVLLVKLGATNSEINSFSPLLWGASCYGKSPPDID